MESSETGSKRPRKDEKPETGSSKMAKVKMAPSAFNAQTGKTIIIAYSWEKTFEDYIKICSEVSSVFGTENHSFHLSLKPDTVLERICKTGDYDSDKESDKETGKETGKESHKESDEESYKESDEEYEDEGEDDWEYHYMGCGCISHDVYLNLDNKSVENEVFISKLVVKSPSTSEEPTTYYNTGLFLLTNTSLSNHILFRCSSSRQRFTLIDRLYASIPSWTKLCQN